LLIRSRRFRNAHRLLRRNNWFRLRLCRRAYTRLQSLAHHVAVDYFVGTNEIACRFERAAIHQLGFLGAKKSRRRGHQPYNKQSAIHHVAPEGGHPSIGQRSEPVN
jgi:hypothetical protein